MGVMNFLTNIMPTVTVPSLDPVIGNLLKLLNNGLGNICITMIVFTLMLKIVTLPFDYISRKNMKKNQMVQERLKPQLEKIDKQYGDNKQMAQQKKSALMRKEGYKIAGACLPSLITMVLFIYTFTAVNSFTTFTNANLYNEMANEYSYLVQEVEQVDGEQKYIYYDPNTYTLNDDGKKLMAEKYKELNPSFLWIKNPLRPDSYKSATHSYNDFKNGTVGLKGLPIEGEYAAYQYNLIMDSIIEGSELTEGRSYNGWNGLLILPILAAAISFLSQFITMRMQKQPQIAGQTQGMMKAMLFIFPAMMLYFALSYTAGFSLYIIFSSGFSTLSTLIISKLVGRNAEKNIEKKKNQMQSYRRR